MASVRMKTGEAKTIRFTITDANGATVDVGEATLTFMVKQKKDDEVAVITKNDGDFDKTQAASGIVDVDVSATDSALPACEYVGELKVSFSASNIDKSADLDFVIEQAVTP
jgi:nitrogen fixation protein FixH